jgi:adenosine deaminase
MMPDNQIQLGLFGESNPVLMKNILNMPKVDLHRHLTGSITAISAIRVASRFNIELPTFLHADLEELFAINECGVDLNTYFTPWKELNKLFISAEAAYIIVSDVIKEAFADNISYLELRTGPRGFLGQNLFSFKDYINALISAAEDIEKEFKITTRFLLGIPRHNWVKIPHKNRNKMFAKIVNDICKYGSGYFVGVDLNGDELKASGEPFKSFFSIARSNGLKATVHAGEIGPAENIRYALMDLGAQRIGHGLASLDDRDVLSLLKEKNCPLEICPTSNVKLQKFKDIRSIPFDKLWSEGIQTVICTDNPARCRTTLSEELFKIANTFHLSSVKLIDYSLLSISNSFCSSDIKIRLEKQLDHFREESTK